MDKPVLGLLIALLLVLANAFFIAAECALVKARSSQIELRVRTGSKTAKMAQQLISHPETYLSVTHLGITLASLGLGWISGPIVAESVLDVMILFGVALDPALAYGIALPIAFILIIFVHIMCGELVPKSLALQYPQPTTLAVAFPLRFFFFLLSPAIIVLNWVANQVLRAIGIEPAGKSAHYHSGEELRMLLEQGHEGKAVKETEHELIENIFEFGSTIVKEVMVPWTNIIALDIAASSQDLLKVAVEEGYTRMPVYDGSLNNIIGIVHAKDLIALLEHRDLIILQDLLRPVYFVPETKLISQLMREFQRRKLHLAIAIDEFGTTAGLVTMEDILEELVGEIQDEHDDESPGVEKIGDGIYVVSGSMTVSDVNGLVSNFKLPEGDNYTTISGLVNKWFEHIPEVNELIERDSIRMTVLKTDNHHVVKVKIENLPLHSEEQ